MKPKQLPSTDYLRQRLDYDPATGILTWRARCADEFTSKPRYSAERQANTWNGKNAGKPALASLTANGYLHGAIDYASYLAHRVIWKHVTGVDADDIDHINGVRTNNRFSNLRSCSRSDNMRNRHRSSNNTSGATGVHLDAPSGLWYAQMALDGRLLYLGRYSVFEDAVAARRSAEIEHGFTPRHGTVR